ncbi:HNH endonuclease signature motif containing protein [Corynebacterium striatum]|uniref:HNH endonuclease signature motif containing protein n=1 Tax=Corynebacterium striatum TaxID=43770 RepID=UPI003B5BC9B2
MTKVSRWNLAAASAAQASINGLLWPASELVCSRPGCDKPWVECDVHHIHAWAAGGTTDLRNLTLQCRGHHVDNNDQRDGARNMGHAERCPKTGRVGYRPAGSGQIFLNDSPAAQKAPARKLSA